MYPPPVQDAVLVRNEVSEARGRDKARTQLARDDAVLGLSTTTRRGAQDPRGARFLDWFEVEVVEQGPCLAGDHRAMVVLNEQTSVAENPIGGRSVFQRNPMRDDF